MRWTDRVFMLFALSGVLGGAPGTARQPSPVAPDVATPAASTLPAGIAPALAPVLARDAGEGYLPRPANDGTPGFVASNPAQHLTAAFLPDAVRLHSNATSAG